MRVLVTGGTGFLGSHTAKALVVAGHEPRLFVRSPDKLEPAMAPLGLEDVDHAVGDVTDVAAVEAALEGCHAVVHTANVYSLDPQRAGEMLDVNPRGTSNVLGTAHRLGLDPIVHVSSNAALMPANGPLTPESPLGDPPGGYSQSKVAAERIARELQEQGAPVVIVNPVGLLGPHDPNLGDFTATAREVLRGRMPFVTPGASPVVDVRDAAAAIAALMEPGRGPRRYMVASGDYLTLRDFARVAARLTGRRLPTVTLPGRGVLATARALDVIGRTLRVRMPFSYEGAWFIVHAAQVDGAACERDLGVRFRPAERTLEDTYRWLVEAGHVGSKHAGRLVSAEPQD